MEEKYCVNKSIDQHQANNSNTKASTVKVARIGIKSENKGILFEDQNYWLLVEVDVLKDIYKVPEFGLKAFQESETEIALWLILKSNLVRYCDQPLGYSEAAKRLISEFFVVQGNLNSSSVWEPIYQKSFASSVQDLYLQLRAAHTAHDDFFHNYSDQYIQHQHLLVNLKPYQMKTIKWMLHRELVLKHTIEFKEIEKRSYDDDDDKSTNFFYDSQTISLTTDPKTFQFIALPSGGILADEMGLGKTIEILDLILLNPRPPNENQFAGPIESSKGETLKAKEVICLCAQTKIENTVCCTKCSSLQHRKCVAQRNSDITPDIAYICPRCWQSEKPLEVKTTFIVSPRSIKTQWKNECDNRIQTGKIAILVYAGTKSCKWVNPMELATYDIILTDYETLRNEFYFSDLNTSNRSLRNTSRCIKRKSPLLNLNFWRVCLDESQMVVEVNTKHAQMVSQLSAVHRWAVTGTPIETSFDDLFSLISFINYLPYRNEYDLWSKNVNKLKAQSNFEPIVSILQPVMWRTSKSQTVTEQMSVPEQTEQVHFVELGNLNRFHYDQERQRCQADFQKIILRLGNSITPLANFNPSNLANILKPAHKLRRNCSILHVLDEVGNTIVMRPSQMFQYLINTNESDAKLELKKLASRMKSCVAFSIGNNKRSSDMRKVTSILCRRVLKWTEKYRNEPTMNDSLLESRAIHNLILVDNVMKMTEQIKCKENLRVLETLFHKRQFDLITNFQADRQKESEKFSSSENIFTRDCYEWANTALKCAKNQDELYVQIRNKISTTYENVGFAISSISQISRELLQWSTNLLQERQKVEMAFIELCSIADDVKSKYESEKQASEFFSILLKEATKCHLMENVDDSDEASQAKKAKIQQCPLCTLTKYLKAYGVFISDTAHKMTKSTGNRTETTNPSFQETILAVILKGNDYASIINTKIGINVLTVLENWRDEFQKYKDVLTLTTKSIRAFHEIQQRKGPKPTSTPLNLDELWTDITDAQQSYVRKIQTNRYLNCIRESNDLKECAICMLTYKYRDTLVVFECGHQSCTVCFDKLKQNHDVFDCPFCREKQSANKANQITMDDTEQCTDSSTKIEHIVREIRNLKRLDPNVKILIFSEWADILSTLKKELFANEILNRSITNNSSLPKIIEEFKNLLLDITCLLMPYKYGSKGLNLIEATQIFLVEPTFNRGEELQTISRVHRIGQTRETCVHRFITKDTIEETIYKINSTEKAGLLSSEKCTLKTLLDFFVDADE